IHRTLMGDGVGTFIAGALGGPPNTTYGENTAVLAITKNYNPKNIFYAAVMAVIFGSITIFGTAVSTIPSAVIGGASIVLFGMISAAGLRAMVDGKVDFSDTKNILVVSVILSLGLGLGAMSLAGDVTGNTAYKLMIGAVEVSPLAIATLVGIVLNLVIPADKKDDVK
ncbi:MAG: solute carrier family 23 protein, partial [Clostridia bacterium]|nr:solute carrier family 23 protein [Clostridia bacterium]